MEEQESDKPQSPTEEDNIQVLSSCAKDASIDTWHNIRSHDNDSDSDSDNKADSLMEKQADSSSVTPSDEHFTELVYNTLKPIVGFSIQQHKLGLNQNEKVAHLLIDRLLTMSPAEVISYTVKLGT